MTGTGTGTGFDGDGVTTGLGESTTGEGEGTTGAGDAVGEAVGLGEEAGDGDGLLGLGLEGGGGTTSCVFDCTKTTGEPVTCSPKT